MSFDRRTLVLAGAAVLIPASACAQTPRVYEIAIRRNVGCGCCRAWNTILQRTGRFTTTMTEDAELAAYKTSLGVPAELASCHTGLVEGYAIEGHVPPEDILRLIAERPAGVRGIAVPGMPIGSPGMESPSGLRDAYDVIAFHADGSQSVFAHHAA